VQQHVYDLLRAFVTEKLSEFLLVIGYAVLFHQRDKIKGRVAGQRRLAEMRIGRDIVVGGRINVGEVTAPAAGDAYLLADPLVMFQQQNLASATPGLDCAEKTRRPAPYDYDIPFLHEHRQLFTPPVRIRRGNNEVL